jgi:hypothetical protein
MSIYEIYYKVLLRCVSNVNELMFSNHILSHEPNTTGVDLKVKCLLTSP